MPPPKLSFLLTETPVILRPKADQPIPEQLMKLRALREAARLPNVTAADDARGATGVRAESASSFALQTASRPLAAYAPPVDYIASSVRGSAMRPEQVARRGSTTEEPCASNTGLGSLSKLRVLDQLQRLRQLQKEGSRMVNCLSQA